jgi:hypothetical protein
MPRYSPAEFKELYNRVLTLSIGVTVVGAVGQMLPDGISHVAFLSSLVLMTVLSNVLLYRAWAQIQDGPARTTPGKAVGFRFIPFFHFYWEFVAVKGLAEDLNAYTRRRGMPAAPVSVDLALWSCVAMIVGDVLSIVPYVGWLFGVPHVVLSLIVLNQVKEASMTVAEARMPAGAVPPIPAHPGGAGLASTAAGLAVVGAVAQGLNLAEKMLGSGGGGASA